MRRLTFVVLLVLALAPSAMAAPIQVQVGYKLPGGTVSSYGPYQTGVGGEFTLNVVQGLDTSQYAAQVSNIAGVAGTFQTFCIEGMEVIYPYPATYNGALSDTAMFGGVKPDGVGDPISKGTGWLYTQFATASWENGLTYHYTDSNRSGFVGSSADLLQKAIWWLEGEENIAYNANNLFMKAVVDKFGSQAAAMADNGGQFSVYALNLWGTGATDTLQNSRVQDQLYYHVPDGGGTLMLLGGALMGLGVLRRKFRV
jgi:hypothetical protein